MANITLSLHHNSQSKACKMYRVTITAPTTHYLNAFIHLAGRMPASQMGGLSAQIYFETEEEAKDYLRDRAYQLWMDTDTDESKYNDCLSDIEKYDWLQYDGAIARIVEDNTVADEEE